MIETHPKAILIMDDKGLTQDLIDYLDKMGYTWRPDPNVSPSENIMEFAGRTCYGAFQCEDGNFENLNLTKTREGNYTYLKNIIESGHGSIFEHSPPVFLFHNVSRVFTHELVRHRIGTSFSQTSGRYVRLDNIKFWIPPIIADNPEACAVFITAIKYSELCQKQLAEIYKIDEIKDFAEKKKLTSAFRRIAPIGLSNNIVCGFNHRALRHVISMRTSEHAEEEVRIVFKAVATQMLQLYTNIYQDMTIGNECTFSQEKI